MHPDPGTASLGEALARVREARGSDSIELRFTALLQADRADLPDHVRGAVALCRSLPVGLDWGRVAELIRFWDHDRATEVGGVRRRAATEFWGRRETPAAPTVDAAT
jgi:CRISPR system Cascade subunit CasB